MIQNLFHAGILFCYYRFDYLLISLQDSQLQVEERDGASK